MPPADRSLYTDLSKAIDAGDMSSMDKSVDWAKRYDGMEMVHLAAKDGKLEVLKWLAGKAADLMSVSDEGHLALHYAASRGHMNIVSQAVMQYTITIC